MTRWLSRFAISVVLTFVVSHSAVAAELVEVFIDARDPAYVIVQGVNSDTPSVAWKEMEGYSQLKNVHLMSWRVFRKQARAILAPYVKINDYPKTQALMGVLTLIKKYPGRPFAVTWNGGVATTFWDYQHAAETLEGYVARPKEYTPMDPKEDPVHPNNQLPDLLSR